MPRYNPDVYVDEAAELKVERDELQARLNESEASRWRAIKYLNEVVFSLDHAGEGLDAALRRARALLTEETALWSLTERDEEVDECLRKISLP